jgi:hypothetical protein
LIALWRKRKDDQDLWKWTPFVAQRPLLADSLLKVMSGQQPGLPIPGVPYISFDDIITGRATLIATTFVSGLAIGEGVDANISSHVKELLDSGPPAVMNLDPIWADLTDPNVLSLANARQSGTRLNSRSPGICGRSRMDSGGRHSIRR